MRRFDDRWDAHWIDPKIDSRTLAEATGELERALDQAKRDHILKILKQSRENITVATAILGIPRASFYYQLQKYGIKLKRRKCVSCGQTHV